MMTINTVDTELLETEGNYHEWESHGFKCYWKRNSLSGILCGYVVVPEGHPAHGMNEWDLCEHVRVHGGVTYAKPEKGGTGYVIGFDCGHMGDFVPNFPPNLNKDAIYRNRAYVEAETSDLAEQLAEMFED